MSNLKKHKEKEIKEEVQNETAGCSPDGCASCGGCGGSIIAMSSILTIASALGASLLVFKKRRK